MKESSVIPPMAAEIGVPLCLADAGSAGRPHGGVDWLDMFIKAWTRVRSDITTQPLPSVLITHRVISSGRHPYRQVVGAIGVRRLGRPGSRWPKRAAFVGRMLDDLTGKVLVTGGNRGIGRAIAVALGEAGADAVVNYRTHQDEADEVCREIERRWPGRRSGHGAGGRGALRRRDASRRQRGGVARAGRDPRQQRGRQQAGGARSAQRRAVGQHDRHQSHLGVSGHAGGAAADAREPVGTHHQRLVGRRAARRRRRDRTTPRRKRACTG